MTVCLCLCVCLCLSPLSVSVSVSVSAMSLHLPLLHGSSIDTFLIDTAITPSHAHPQHIVTKTEMTIQTDGEKQQQQHTAAYATIHAKATAATTAYKACQHMRMRDMYMMCTHTHTHTHSLTYMYNMHVFR